MTETKKGKRKSGGKWIVGWIVEKGNLRIEYEGPNRVRARETAQKVLTRNPKLQVFAWRVSAVTVLLGSDLKLSLRKDSF